MAEKMVYDNDTHYWILFDDLGGRTVCTWPLDEEVLGSIPGIYIYVFYLEKELFLNWFWS